MTDYLVEWDRAQKSKGEEKLQAVKALWMRLQRHQQQIHAEPLAYTLEHIRSFKSLADEVAPALRRLEAGEKRRLEREALKTLSGKI